MLLLAAIGASAPMPLWAASCCGGGSATSLILPKFSRGMVEIAVDYESYDGYWNQDGDHVPDPPGSDLNQYRINAGYAHRLGANWQASVIVPYVWNNNTYAGLESNTSGIGDTTLNLWYEAFDTVMCVWKVRSWEDLKPATFLGLSLTVPTGVSPYDDAENSFDITGRGFYRLDALALVEKTIYPWTVTAQLAYGKYLERSVNREYGNYVAPYDKQLGDRVFASVSFGYTWFLQSMNSVTLTGNYADLSEGEGTLDGVSDPTTGFRKRSVGATLAHATADRNWVTKLIWNHAIDQDGWGENFPTTDIVTVGVSRVIR
ncbi:MAG: hypothetical protein AMJ69_11120 [Gammaproteobacteria bacterium SG8_47]|nr:MAG: hypothetical protein AMJ69_11120 [Gammaproteobacteria bacterium SG8_47]